MACRAVVADCFYGDHDDAAGTTAPERAGLRHGAQTARGTWQYGAEAYTPKDAARAVPWDGPDDPGGWQPVQRTFRDGHTETWWAADAQLGWWGPDGHTRLVVATTDPATLPDKATWYLATNLPRPGGPHDTPDAPHEPADLTEVVRLYGIRHWIEQSYKQVKDELGWADFQVRSATAIRRHQTLVHCAFSFCWNTWFDPPIHKRPNTCSLSGTVAATTPERGGPPAEPPAEHPSWPKALRAVRAWLTPWLLLQRWWKAWTHEPPPENSSNSSTPSNKATPSTSTYHHKGDKLPLDRRDAPAEQPVLQVTNPRISV